MGEAAELMEERLSILADSKPISPKALAAMKWCILSAVQNGIITKEQYFQWRKDNGYSDEMQFDEYAILKLYGDLHVKKQTGKWRPTPF